MPTIEVSNETFEKIKDQLNGDFVLTNFDDMIGKKFFFRTFTYHTVGEVVGFLGSFVKLKNASWVADTGRFMNAIKEGLLCEVEPVGDFNINMTTVVDFCQWKHKLPKEQL